MQHTDRPTQVAPARQVAPAGELRIAQKGSLWCGWCHHDLWGPALLWSVV